MFNYLIKIQFLNLKIFKTLIICIFHFLVIFLNFNFHQLIFNFNSKFQINCLFKFDFLQIFNLLNYLKFIFILN